MSPELVEDIISFYYGTVRKSLSGLAHYNIVVENLGSFRVKVKELPLLGKKYEKHLSILTKDTFSQMALRKEILSKRDNLLKLEALILSEKTRKYEFFKKKNEQIQQNLASQKVDT